jgi:hypothetical protein
MKSIYLSTLILWLCLSSFGQNANNNTEVESLRQEVIQLKADVIELKAEVQQLRKLLASQQPSTQSYNTQPKQVENPSDNPSNTSGDKDCWCTKSSNKRHNSSCRYYKASNGYPCGKNEGIPCKLCGG